MPYIGKTPVIGNFVKLDAISVVNGQAAYTMNNGGSAFTAYNNVNQFLVSLNGVLQAPTDSFTVSGSTLTFASNLATGDVIDFVIVLGNTLDIGTPSDNTVTNAKLATTSITGQTAETSAADADTILIHDDSASALRKMTRSNFLSGVGGTNTPNFSAYIGSSQNLSDNVDTKVDFDTEDFDTASAYDTTNKRFTVPSGQGGKYFFYSRIGVSSGNISQYIISIRVNNSQVAKRDLFSGGATTKIFNDADDFNYEISCLQNLSAGDYVEVFMQINHALGSTPTLDSGSIHSEFSGYKIIE